VYWVQRKLREGTQEYGPFESESQAADKFDQLVPEILHKWDKDTAVMYVLKIEGEQITVLHQRYFPFTPYKVPTPMEDANRRRAAKLRGRTRAKG